MCATAITKSASRTRSRWLLVLLVALSGCRGGTAPTSPTAAAALPASFTLSGVVSEPAGDPVPGAHVQISGKTAITDEAGRYTVRELSGWIGLELSKDGYEPVTMSGYQMVNDRVLNIVLAPTIRIAAGESRTLTLYDDDRGYEFRAAYEACPSPCKLIRVSVPARGALTVKLTSPDAARKLSVLTSDGHLGYCCTAQLTIPLDFPDPGEQILYVTFSGRVPSADRRIDVATSFQPR
jgi:hypothetical protein